MNQELNEKIKKADKLIDENPSRAVTAIKEILRKGIDLLEDEAYLYYILGIARTKCGRFFLAKKAFEKANELLPNNSENLRNLGWVMFILNDVDGGRNYLRQAISLDLMNSRSYVDLAVTYLRDFDFKESKEWIQRANALDPNNHLILNTIRMIKQSEKDFNKLSKLQINKMEEEKRDPKVQLSYRMSILEKFYFKKALTKDESDEVKEEARLNGFSSLVITEKQEDQISQSKSNQLKIREILKERKYIEKELGQLLKKVKSHYSVEDIKKIIWNEKGDEEFSDIVKFFDIGDPEELGYALAALNDAWNYFPHKCLGGLCPMEKILEQKTKYKLSN